MIKKKNKKKKLNYYINIRQVQRHAKQDIEIHGICYEVNPWINGTFCKVGSNFLHLPFNTLTSM